MLARRKSPIAALVAALSLAASAAARPGRVLSRNATITVAVTGAPGAVQRIESDLPALDGRLASATDSQLVVRVPDARYRELVLQIERIGVASGEHVSTVDLTAQVADLASRERAAVESRDRLVRLKTIAKNVPEELALEHAIEGAEDDVEDAKQRREKLEQSAGVTTVTITLRAPAPVPIGEPKLPFGWLDTLGLEHVSDTSTRATPPSPGLSSFIDGRVGMRGERSARGGRLGDPAGAVSLDLGLRALSPSEPIGFFGGFDLGLGGGTGFLYRVQTLGGFGFPVGRRLAVGVATGPGIDGLTSRIPFGVTLPAELYVDLDAASFMGVSLYADDGWVFAAKARRDGARHAPFGDEARAGIWLSIGGRDDSDTSSERNGLRIGFEYREAMGTSLYGVELAFGAHQADFTTW